MTPERRWLSACLALSLPLALAGCFQRGVTPIRTHFNKGVYHYAEGDFDAAIHHYRLALEEDIGDHRARFNLAEALERRATRLALSGSTEPAEALRQEAEEHYLKILASDPENLRATVNLAAREYQKGATEAAERRLRAAIERYPRSALPRISLATQRFHAEDPAALRSAVELLEEALHHDPDNLDANVLLGHAFATLARHEATSKASEPGDTELVEQARLAYRRALKRSDTDIGTLLALARLERGAGHSDKAETLLRRVLYVRSDLFEAHLMLSEILDEAGQLEEATVHLWRSRQLEEPGAPRLDADEYQRRLLDLYRRLAEEEQDSNGAPPP